jgi:hypothetical protein
LIANAKKLLTTIECVAPFFCIILAAACGQKNPLDLNYNSFDQRPGRGWRQLAEKGQFLEAAKLIDDYIAKHKDLDMSQRPNLNFHAAQMYAFADDDKTAIDRLNNSTYPFEPPELPLRWNAYVYATIAFLKKDMERLKECRKEIAEGPTFEGKKANLDVVDRLIKYFDEPYSKAYGARRN